MIGPLKITATLASPLAGEAPYLDRLCEWVIAHFTQKDPITRKTRLTEAHDLPVPISRVNISGHRLYSCSTPIYCVEHEWQEHVTKSFSTNYSDLISVPRVINVATGPYKAQRRPVRVRLINKISWFVHGNREGLRRTLRHVRNLGPYRKIGYGVVSDWKLAPVGEDLSLLAEDVLMRSVPYDEDWLRDKRGWRRIRGSLGGPSWHNQTQQDIAIPC